MPPVILLQPCQPFGTAPYTGPALCNIGAGEGIVPCHDRLASCGNFSANRPRPGGGSSPALAGLGGAPAPAAPGSAGAAFVAAGGSQPAAAGPGREPLRP